MNDGIARFENLNVRQESLQLSIEIYQLLKETKDFAIREKMVC